MYKMEIVYLNEYEANTLHDRMVQYLEKHNIDHSTVVARNFDARNLPTLLSEGTDALGKFRTKVHGNGRQPLTEDGSLGSLLSAERRLVEKYGSDVINAIPFDNIQSWKAGEALKSSAVVVFYRNMEEVREGPPASAVTDPLKRIMSTAVMYKFPNPGRRKDNIVRVYKIK